MSEVILEILKILLPALIVLITAYLMLSQTLGTYLKMQRVELGFKNREQALPVRLQAFERLVLYLERISPQRAIPRLRQEGMSAPELHMLLISSIRMEYEHNITQQLYVSPDTWFMVRTATEEVISIINQVAASIPPESSSLDFSRVLLASIMESTDGSPIDIALENLKVEAREMFA